MLLDRYCVFFVLVASAACASDGDGGESSEGTGPLASDTGTSAVTENPGPESSSSGGAQWPECVTPAGPDITVGVVLDPPQPDSMWHRFSGPCEVSSATAQGGTASIDLDCSGADGPAPEWSTSLTVEGFDGDLPAVLSQGASVDLVVVLQQSNLRFAAFALSMDDAVVLAGLSGNNPDVEDGLGGAPQSLWAPLVVSREMAQVCPEQPGVECPLSVARNAIVFTGLDEPAIEAFDHSVVEAVDHTYRVGRALAFVDDGSGMVCEGSDPTWYDFVVSRLP